MSLLRFLQDSSATDAFRAAVDEFASSGAASDRIRYSAGAPPIKVERTLTKMLAAYPGLAIDAVELDGSSGCEFFRGELRIRAAGAERHVRFEWNCKWKASEQGWIDWFGFPDQVRAARAFGYDCFQQWEEVAAPAAPTPPPARAAATDRYSS